MRPQDVVIVNKATTEDGNVMFELYVLLGNGKQVLDVNSLKDALEVHYIHAIIRVTG